MHQDTLHQKNCRKRMYDPQSSPCTCEPEETERFLHGYSAESMVERAVRNARARVAGPSPRWVAVMDTFALGSTYAHDLCRKFGLDPDEEVRGAAKEVS